MEWLICLLGFLIGYLSTNIIIKLIENKLAR